MTHEELFQCFYSVIDKGSGKEITTFFNEQLNKAKGSDEDLEFLKRALEYYKHYRSEMTFETKDIFETLVKEVRKNKRR